jgi:hypothetical protein
MKSTELLPVGHKVLNSWKEVAHYLERGIRTVQRWEADLGLPVRRPRGKKRSAVIAICSEIDEWVDACPAFIINQGNGHESRPCKTRVRGRLAGQPTVNETILRSRFLRGHVRRSREELAKAIVRLVGTLKTATENSEARGSQSQRLLPADCLQAKEVDASATGSLFS